MGAFSSVASTLEKMDEYEAEGASRRQRVASGLPVCLTEAGIAEVVFKPGTSYHQQQAAFAALSQLRKRGETDCL